MLATSVERPGRAKRETRDAVAAKCLASAKGKHGAQAPIRSVRSPYTHLTVVAHILRTGKDTINDRTNETRPSTWNRKRDGQATIFATYIT